MHQLTNKSVKWLSIAALSVVPSVLAANDFSSASVDGALTIVFTVTGEPSDNLAFVLMILSFISSAFLCWVISRNIRGGKAALDFYAPILKDCRFHVKPFFQKNQKNFRFFKWLIMMKIKISYDNR